MAKDNTLGAPTEGLGQTVTFAAGASGPTSRAVGGSRGSISNDPARGGLAQTVMAQRVQVQPDPTFGVLMRLGSEVLKPHVEAAATEAYVAGMQKVAQGQAVTEIVDEQPWYSKVFGPTSLVDGARAYSAATAATSAAVDMEANMTELRKLSPDEFAKHAAGLLTAKRTGDPVTDAMIMSQASQALPSVLKSQAKNHLIWQNEKLVESQQSYLDTLGAKVGQLGAKARTGEELSVGPLPSGAATDQSDYLEAQTEYARAVASVPVGMDKKVYQKIVANSIIHSLASGNFAVFNTLESSGQLDKMPPEVISSVRSAHRAASAEARAQLPKELIDKQADWITAAREPGATAETVWAKAEELNAQYTRMTGDKTKYISNGQVAMELAQMEVYQEQQAQHARAQLAKAQTQQAKEAAHIDYIKGRSEQAVQGFSLSTDKKEDRELIFTNIKATLQPDQYFGVLAKQNYYGTRHEAFEEYTRGAVGMARDTGNAAALDAAYRNSYLPLLKAGGTSGNALAQDYLGEYGGVMDRYHKAFTASQEPDLNTRVQLAFAQAIIEPPKAAPSKKVKDLTAVKKDGTFMRLLKLTWPDDDIPVKDPEGLAELVAPRAPDHLPADKAMAYVLNNDKTINLLGGRHWQSPVGAEQFKDWLANPQHSAAEGLGSNYKERAFKHALDVVGKEVGIDASEAAIYQVPTGAGIEPVLYVVGLTPDGHQRTGLLPANRVAKEWKLKQAKSPEARVDPHKGVKYPATIEPFIYKDNP